MHSGSIGYPRQSPIVRIELYGSSVGPIQYEQSPPPPKSDASATNAVIQKLHISERACLYTHYVWHRYQLKAIEKARRLGVSRATYYRSLGQAKQRLQCMLGL